MFHGTPFSADTVWGWAFLEAIAEHAPAVLDDLAGEPYQRVADAPANIWWIERSGLPLDSDVRRVFEAWAARYRTPELVSAGLRQCANWVSSGGPDGHRLTWTMPHLTPDAVPSQAPPLQGEFTYTFTIDDQTDRDAVRAAVLAAFDAQTSGLFDHCRRRREVFTSMNSQTYNAPTKRKAADHLAWLVRHQIRDEFVYAIHAGIPSRTYEAVRLAIQTTATMVGIHLRPSTPPGLKKPAVE